MKSLRCCFGGSPRKSFIDEDSISRKKVVLVGDGYCGKTCLQVAFRTDNFSDALGGDGGNEGGKAYDDVYRATLFENYATTFSYLNDMGHLRTLELAIWDTAGQEDYERLRPLSYPDTDVLLLCFSIDSPDSLENVESKWKPELEYFCPRVPVVLVGNKVDLREDEQTLESLKRVNTGPVKMVDGRAMAERIGAAAYVECSAKTKHGVREVFETVARISAIKRPCCRRKFFGLIRVRA